MVRSTPDPASDLNTIHPNVVFNTFVHKPDVVFLFNIGSWVGRWPIAVYFWLI